MKTAKLLVLVGLSTWLASAAFGDDASGSDVRVAGKTVVEQLLDIMLATGTIDRDQYDELLEQSREEEAAAAAAIAQVAESKPPAVAEGAPGWKFSWKNGFHLEREDGAFKLKFGGRIMVDTANIWEDDSLRDTIGGQGNGVEARRARIFFSGTVYDRLFFKAQYDFAQADDDDNPDFKDVYMGLEGLGPVGSVQVGHFKETLFLNEWTSSNYITFMERGLNNVFYPGRNMGVMATNDVLDKRLLWQLGVYRDTNDQGFAFDAWDDVEWNITGRLVGVPIYEDEGRKLLHIGAGYSHQFRGEDGSVRYRERPEAHLANRYVDTQDAFIGFDPAGDTMNIPTQDVDLLNAELAGVWGPLSLQTEFTGNWVSGRGSQPDLFLWGVYAYASWFLTGEHRPYDLGKGRFGRLEPKAYFNPLDNGWGAWELALRFSYLDLNDANVRGGKLWALTAGLNWYLYPNARIMLNYVFANLDDRRFVSDDMLVDPDLDGRSNILEARFQVDF